MVIDMGGNGNAAAEEPGEWFGFDTLFHDLGNFRGISFPFFESDLWQPTLWLRGGRRLTARINVLSEAKQPLGAHDGSTAIFGSRRPRLCMT